MPFTLLCRNIFTLLLFHITLLFLPVFSHHTLIRSWRAHYVGYHTSIALAVGAPSVHWQSHLACPVCRLSHQCFHTLFSNHSWRAQYVGYHTSSAHAVFLFIPAHAMFSFTQQHSSLTCTLSLTPTSQHLLISFQPRV